ncbi:MAG: universal stress protein [Gemmatimonadota bacterium]|nr:universal stress protein [Gemmatimonadota bacterium]
MYDIIMAPTDGSGFDREAIAVATRLSNAPGAQLKIVRVYSAPMVFTGPDTVDFPREAIERERQWESSQLGALAAECAESTSAEVSSSLREGPVADTLVSYARENHVDLIVITSHGRAGIARAALGSVTDALIRNTNIPVFVVKRTPSYLAEKETRPFRKILVPLDGSKLAEEIIPQVIELATKNEAEVVLVNVLTPVNYSQKRIEDSALPWWENDISVAQTYLGEQAERIRGLGVPASIEITIGEDAADGITRSASRLRADLIAIATRGRGGFSRLMRGSVADKVVRASRQSLLVFHPQPHMTGKPLARARTDFAAAIPAA